MKPITYRAVGEFRKERKLKSGLAPTGVLRQNLVPTQQFPDTNIRCPTPKDKRPHAVST
jgi:hypothetical protein